jgi:hypothetical protein
VDGRRQKGHIIAVNAAEMLVMELTVYAVRQAFHGGEIIAHKRSPTCKIDGNMII